MNGLTETGENRTPTIGLQEFWRSVWVGCTLYLLSSLPVFWGVVCGYTLIEPGRPIPQTAPYGEDCLLQRFAAWDGGQFMSIMDSGYSFDRERISNIVVFPGFPLTAKLVQLVTGLSSAAALLLVSNLSLCLTFVVLHRYLRIRFLEDQEVIDWSLIAFAFFPTTFFFRMAYSEAPFLLLIVTILLGIQRRWRIEWLCLLAGVATGFRLAGVMLILPLFVYQMEQNQAWSRRLLSRCLWLPLSVFGLLAFMLFQYWQLGDALAFSHGQANYCLRPPVSVLDHWYRLVTLEPVWGNYMADSSAYWKNHSVSPVAVLNLQFANPVYFAINSVLLILGWRRRWLTDGESALGIGLLLIGYLGRAEEFCMGCQGRYAAVVIPVYIVWGQVLKRVPPILRIGIAALCVALLTIYSGCFAAWYFFL